MLMIELTYILVNTWYEMNNYINVISIFLVLSKLCLNIDKIVFMIPGNYIDSVPNDFNILINGKKIEET